MSVNSLRRLLDRQPHHVSPFLVLGDPTPELSVELATAAARSGATMIELGIPYGDPCADGPVIQAANVRAFEAGVDTAGAIGLMARIRRNCPDVALNLLVYGNLVHARGYERFCHDVVGAGASSLLVPDIPLEENSRLRSACARAELGHCELVGPLTSPERLVRIDEAVDGFLYLVAHQGVTGVRDETSQQMVDLVRRTARAVKAPVCVGFGLSRADQLRQAFAAGARICVVGSYLASAISDGWTGAVAGRESRVHERFIQAFEPLAASAQRAQPVSGGASCS